MKKVILTAVIGLLSLMSFGQYRFDYTIPITDSLKDMLDTHAPFSLQDMDQDQDFFIREDEAKLAYGIDFDNNAEIKLNLSGINFFHSLTHFELENAEIYDGLEDLLKLNLYDLTLENTNIKGELNLSDMQDLKYLDIRGNPKLDSVCVHPNLVGNSNFFILIGTNTKVFTNNCQTEVYVCQNKLQFTKCPDPLSTTNTVSTSKEFSLFPNPVQNELTFNLEEVSSVSIYSVDGIEVFTSNEIVNNTVNLSSLAQGKYLVKLITEDKVISKMIIKD